MRLLTQRKKYIFPGNSDKHTHTHIHTHTHTHIETNMIIRKFSEKEVNLTIDILPAYFVLLCFISLFHFILLGDVYGY